MKVELEKNIVTYVRDNYYTFNKRQETYMREHFEESSQPLFRVVSYEDGDYGVGDTITYDRMRSFSEGRSGFSQTLQLAEDTYSLEEDVTVLRIDKGKGYNISSVVKSNSKEFGGAGNPYIRQNESLSMGKYKVKKVSEDTYQVSGHTYKIKTLHLQQES